MNKSTRASAEKGSAESHDISALTNLLCERTSTFRASGTVLLLAVMLDAGPYSEQAESRLRARQAVLEGLSESGFVPIDGEHIGFVTAPWPPAEANVPFPAIDRALLLPWEECEALTSGSRKGFSRGREARRRGLVARSRFQSQPIALFRRLDRSARAEGPARENRRHVDWPCKFHRVAEHGSGSVLVPIKRNTMLRKMCSMGSGLFRLGRLPRM